MVESCQPPSKASTARRVWPSHLRPRDVDRSPRHGVGWWITFAGPFRYLDLMGVQSYWRVIQDLLPDLSTGPEIPPLMQKAVESGRRRPLSRWR